MKQISSFMGEIGDEFKIVVVKAIRELCLKYVCCRLLCLSQVLAAHPGLLRLHLQVPEEAPRDGWLHGHLPARGRRV